MCIRDRQTDTDFLAGITGIPLVEQITDCGEALAVSPVAVYAIISVSYTHLIEREFDGRGYGDFKLAVGEVVADGLASLHAEYDRLIADKAYWEQVMKIGAESASRIAVRTMRKVYKKIGFVQL